MVDIKQMLARIALTKRRKQALKRQQNRATYKPVFSSGRRSIDAIEDMTARVIKRGESS